MTCNEFDRLLDRLPWPASAEKCAAAERHAAECPRCAALWESIGPGSLAIRGAELPAAALILAQTAALSDLSPVQPLAAPAVTASITSLALAGVAALALLESGIAGWVARTPWQRTASYSSMGAVLLFMLWLTMRERIPGGGLAAPLRWFGALAALVAVSVPFLLYGFQPEPAFWTHGALCCCNGLVAGALCAVVLFLVLRAGSVLNQARAGGLAGLAAGCAAFMIQESYCPVVESGHAALWHGSVPVLLGLAGLAVGWLLARRAEPPAMNLHR